MVHGFDGMHPSGAAKTGYGSPDFVLVHLPVGQSDEARPVDQGLHFRRYILKIGRGSQNDTLSRYHLFDIIVGRIVLNGAPLVLILETLVAGNAPVNRLCRELNDFRFDALFLDLPEEIAYQLGGVAVFPWTAVEADNLHIHPPFRHEVLSKVSRKDSDLFPMLVPQVKLEVSRFFIS